METIVHKPNKDVTISRFMAGFGRNAPVVDVDFLFTFYAYAEPCAIVDFKQLPDGAELNAKCYNNTNATTILRLGDRAKLPAYVIGYSSDWRFRVLRWNEEGRTKLEAFRNAESNLLALLDEEPSVKLVDGKYEMDAIAFVRFSYFLRNLPVDKGILSKFKDADCIELTLRAEKVKAMARGGDWDNQEAE